MLWEQKVEFAALSDIGIRRKNNQDSFVVQTLSAHDDWERRGHLFLVADGMGGHAVGELASKIAADTIPHAFMKSTDDDSENALREAISQAHRAIHEKGQLNRDFTRMGTTCTTLVLGPLGAIIGHVGDSRCYRIRGERIEQLTFDHSLQWELLKQGTMSPEDIFRYEPRNVITRSLGPEPHVQVDVEGPYIVRPGDTYLLCSDGLSGLVKDEEMGMIGSALTPTLSCRMLVDLANLRGGTDNITVVVVRVGPLPPGAVELRPERRHEAASPYGWSWLMAVTAVGLTMLAGFTMGLFGRPVEGIYTLAVAVAGMGAVILAWLRFRRGYREPVLSAVSTGTPYRTASAKLTPNFINELAGLESSLQQTAHDEGWTVDWGEHTESFQAAKSALSSKRYAESVEHYSKAIHTLLEPLRAQRKHRDQIAKWGAKTSPHNVDPRR